MAEVAGSDLRQRKKPPSTPAPKTSQVEKIPEIPHEQPSNLEPYIIFSLVFVHHVIAALCHPIQDCDEVFNYWEPTHYLTHGHGFQTWEYSPVYAIRSWAYAGLHALVTLVGKGLPFGIGTKTIEFYLLRITLGLVCALCETRLFYAITAALNHEIATFFVLIMASSTGMYHASVAYLPSSFTMYTTMLGMAAFMNWSGGLRTARGIFAIGAGAVWGWPFAAAMAVPFLIEEVALAAISDSRSRSKLFARVADGIGSTLLALALQAVIDGYFYRKSVIVPFNIVWYNMFSKGGGPGLYGTEPWHFYLRNLFLNFHVWFVLAILSMPLLLVQHFLLGKGTTKASHWRSVVFLSPFYLWLGIFMLQPHKEERFMYPAYPSLALNASVAFSIILANFGSTDGKDATSKVPVQLRQLIILLTSICLFTLSFSRTFSTINAYSAPLSIYQPLHDPAIAHPNDIVCLGKEWHRFPSHFLLPPHIEAKFIKSEFSGLLPGEFYEGISDSGAFPGASINPPGMNDENREDLSKYTKLKHCNFLIDLHLPSTRVTDLEPNYIADTENWERVKCLPFLDSTATPLLARLLWTPNLSVIPQEYRRMYGDYCLLKRRKVQGVPRQDPVPHIETLG